MISYPYAYPYEIMKLYEWLYISKNGMKKHCFSLFFVMKKNEKQCFVNLITRRSSVQIWLPQPNGKEHSSKWNSWRCKFSCWFAWMFFFYYIMLNAFCQSLCVEFSRLIFVDLETARSAMVRIRRRIRRHEMAECSFLIGRGWKCLKSSGCLRHFWFCWRSETLTLKLKVRMLIFLKIENGCKRKHHFPHHPTQWKKWYPSPNSL